MRALPLHPDWRRTLDGALARVRSAFWPAVQASLAAALAWLVALRVLGHAQPFFAPVAAAVSMSTNYAARSKRTVQMVGGVLLGIGASVLLVSIWGRSTVALGATVLLTMLVARAVAGGFFGEGMMFVNQAAVSAILVVTLSKHGTGADRALDALVGGGAALVVGVLLFPVAPLPRLWLAERAVLGSLADALGHVADLAARREPPAPDWTLAASHDLHQQLARLAEGRNTARAVARIAPRRWRERARVAAEDRRVARLDLLADAVLSLVRLTVLALEEEGHTPSWLPRPLRSLADALRTLADTAQPWPATVIKAASAAAKEAIDAAPLAPVDRAPTAGLILRAVGQDLAALVDSAS